jgi:CxxC motif-containing protein
METIRELTCIGCPIGCVIEVDLRNKNDLKVTGYTCKRGIEYGIKECTNPTRILTTTLKVEKGTMKVVPVKTSSDIPKDSIFACTEHLRGLKAKAPIHIGEVLVYNILGTGADIVATMDIPSE